MRPASRILAAALVAVGLLAVPAPARADDQSISVNFAATTTAPTYRASGWIYGMTENGAAPPGNFFTDIKFRAMRAGGAQLPGSGWVGGGYDRRWNATRAQMLRTQALGGKFVLLPHDLWGADGAGIARFPGDNGDWTDYNAFLTRVFADVRATGVAVEWDIWNEPNLSIFWNRSQAQYFELWRRTYQRLRAEMPGTLIVGPSLAGVPSTGAGWWTQYLDHVKANSALPDIISWHSLPGDPVANVAAADTSLAARGIPHTRPYQINEYGAGDEQNPGDGAWYITRLERAGADGLRANWASGGNLHDDLGNLLLHNSAGQYQTKGEWWVYRFYAGQAGTAVASTPSTGYDAYATKTDGSAKVLIGGGRTTGTLTVNLQGLHTTSGIVTGNQVRVQVHRIPHNNGGAVSGPVAVQDQVVTLNGNATTVTLANTTVIDAYTITVLPPGATAGFSSVAVAQHSGMCLDNTDLRTTDGNQQQQYPCDGGPQQQWNFRPVTGVADTYTLVNRQSGKCLDVSGVSTANGAVVHQWTCLAGAQNQQFTLRRVSYAGNDPRDHQLVARHSGKCVDVSGVSTAARAVVLQWTCNPIGQAAPLNQTWRLLTR